VVQTRGRNKITKEQELELIRRYAPILWLHEDDAFLPEDCKVMEEFAKVGTSNANMKPFKLDELAYLKDSKKYYMDIPEIDFNNFGLNSEYDGPKLGPEALSDHVRKKFSNNTFLYPNARPSLPKYHARVSKISITYRDDPDSRTLRTRERGAFGDYNVIQYYFYYIFNDSWNKHVSDWDSTMEMFIKEDNTRAYAILHMHHITWMVKFSGKSQKLKKWIADWKEVENKKHMGWSYQYGAHPFVFIVNGAHGGYPSPGFSIHGTKVFKAKVIGQTDYRQIGKLCIFPDYVPIKKEIILNILKEANIDTSKTKFLPWEEPVILDKQPWLKYKGVWGTKSEYKGWGGPTGPSRKHCWRMDQRRFKKALIKAISGDYFGDWPFKILKNWHGWR